jgi:hypothetical protein
MQSGQHEIIQGLMTARIHAQLIAEQWPANALTLNNFHAELMQIQLRLVDQLGREGLHGREPIRVDDGPPIS